MLKGNREQGDGANLLVSGIHACLPRDGMTRQRIYLLGA